MVAQTTCLVKGSNHIQSLLFIIIIIIIIIVAVIIIGISDTRGDFSVGDSIIILGRVFRLEPGERGACGRLL